MYTVGTTKIDPLKYTCTSRIPCISWYYLNCGRVIIVTFGVMNFIHSTGGCNTIEMDERAKKQLEVSRTIPSMFPFTLQDIYIVSKFVLAVVEWYIRNMVFTHYKSCILSKFVLAVIERYIRNMVFTMLEMQLTKV